MSESKKFKIGQKCFYVSDLIEMRSYKRGFDKMIKTATIVGEEDDHYNLNLYKSSQIRKSKRLLYETKENAKEARWWHRPEERIKVATDFKVGEKYYYVSENGHGFDSRIRCGTLVRTTAKFCVLDVSKAHHKRKAKKLVFADKREALATLLRKLEISMLDEYGLSLATVFEQYESLLEEYPEKFV